MIMRALRAIKRWFKTTDFERRDMWALVTLIMVGTGVVADSVPATFLALVPAFLAGFYLSRESGAICEECGTDLDEAEKEIEAEFEIAAEDEYELRA